MRQEIADEFVPWLRRLKWEIEVQEQDSITTFAASNMFLIHIPDERQHKKQ